MQPVSKKVIPRPVSLAQLRFEEDLLDIFHLTDTRQKLNALQNYFFPSLKLLLKHTTELLQEVYGPAEEGELTWVYRPNPRPKADQPIDYNEVYIGLCGRSRFDRPLVVKNDKGKPFTYHPTYLIYKMNPAGSLLAELLVYRYRVDQGFTSAISTLIRQHLPALTPILFSCHISYTGAERFEALCDAIASRFLRFFSPAYHFPIDVNHGLPGLVRAFVALYPLLDSSIAIAEGRRPRLGELLEAFQSRAHVIDSRLQADSAPRVRSIPDVDSVLLELPVRPGLRYRVFQRDDYRCCLCGRSRNDGVNLRVDHVVPRAWGGPDDIKNYQTLCEECNSGKSDTDWADFRSRTLLPGWIKEQLRLTQEQQRDILAIRDDFQSRYKAELGQMQKSLETFREAIQAERAHEMERVKGLLSAEQRAMLDAIRRHWDGGEDTPPSDSQEEAEGDADGS